MVHWCTRCTTQRDHPSPSSWYELVFHHPSPSNSYQLLFHHPSPSNSYKLVFHHPSPLEFLGLVHNHDESLRTWCGYDEWTRKCCGYGEWSRKCCGNYGGGTLAIIIRRIIRRIYILCKWRRIVKTNWNEHLLLLFCWPPLVYKNLCASTSAQPWRTNLWMLWYMQMFSILLF